MTTTNTMQAAIYESYGAPEVLQLKNINIPTPKDNEVLIKIHSTTVTSGDYRMRKADPYIVRLFAGLFKPKDPILGHELSGEVVEAGSSVTRFKKGDMVYGATGLDSGTYAEYISMPEDAPLVIKPALLDDDEAAAIPVGATTALHFLQKANIQPGQNVLIYGASGSLGTYAVQLAKHFGATVTGVCSGKNSALVKSLGADKVVDYTKEDITSLSETYDIIFDTVGKTTFNRCKKIMKPRGRFVAAVMGKSTIWSMLTTSLIGSKKVIGGVSVATTKALEFLTGLIEDGDIKAVIDRAYPLAEIQQAHGYVEKGHKVGNVIVSVS